MSSILSEDIDISNIVPREDSPELHDTPSFSGTKNDTAAHRLLKNLINVRNLTSSMRHLNDVETFIDVTETGTVSDHFTDVTNGINDAI